MKYANRCKCTWTTRWRDGNDEIATIKQIIYPADSDKWFGKVSYAVEWATGEWGTFDEDELAEINNEAR